MSETRLNTPLLYCIIYVDTGNIFDFFYFFLQKLTIIQTKTYIVHCMKFCNFSCPIHGAPGTPGEDQREASALSIFPLIYSFIYYNNRLCGRHYCCIKLIWTNKLWTSRFSVGKERCTWCISSYSQLYFGGFWHHYTAEGLELNFLPILGTHSKWIMRVL